MANSSTAICTVYHGGTYFDVLIYACYFSYSTTLEQKWTEKKKKADEALNIITKDIFINKAIWENKGITQS